MKLRTEAVRHFVGNRVIVPENADSDRLTTAEALQFRHEISQQRRHLRVAIGDLQQAPRARGP